MVNKELSYVKYFLEQLGEHFSTQEKTDFAYDYGTSLRVFWRVERVQDEVVVTSSYVGL